MTFIVVACIAVVLSVLDIWRLAKSGKRRNIVVYLGLMVVALGLLGLQTFSGDASIAGLLLGIFGWKE